MEEKYIFEKSNYSNIKTDLIFDSNSFEMCENPRKEMMASVLFIVNHKSRNVLIDSQGEKYTCFLGDINKCKEIGSEFRN